MDENDVESKYAEDTQKQFFKLPVGECYLEFLSGAIRKMITYKEGDAKDMLCYQINAFTPQGASLAQNIEFALPRSILDAVQELKLQHGGTVVSGWLKVKRTGTTKTDTVYKAYPSSKPSF